MCEHAMAGGVSVSVSREAEGDAAAPGGSARLPRARHLGGWDVLGSGGVDTGGAESLN